MASEWFSVAAALGLYCLGLPLVVMEDTWRLWKWGDFRGLQVELLAALICYLEALSGMPGRTLKNAYRDPWNVLGRVSMCEMS